MKIHRVTNEENMKEITRLALIDQSLGHITQTLISIEGTLTRMEMKIDSNLKWMLSVYFAGFGALFGMIAHIQHWI